MTALGVNCRFYARTPASNDGGYLYGVIYVPGPASPGDGIWLELPPAVGDKLYLYDTINKEGGIYTVVVRQWFYPQYGSMRYGSMGWPYDRVKPTSPPDMDIIVEKSKGVFLNKKEVDSDE